MLDLRTDQADGLRRMFGGSRTRVLDIVAGTANVGRTSIAVNLGAALARAGRNTLLVDFVADVAQSRVHRSLGMLPAPDQGPLPVCKGFGVLAVSHREWMQAGPLTPSALGAGSAIRRNAFVPDWVLVNGAGLEPVVAADDGGRDVLVVLSNAADSITEAYALVKRMAARGDRCRYRVLVNRVHSHEAALRIFRNVAQAARGYLDVELALIGFIPVDAAVDRAAAEGVSVFEHDPASAAAQAFARLADAVGHWAPARPLRRVPIPDTAVALGAS